MTSIHLKTKYLDDDATPSWGEYSDGSTALRFLDRNGQPLATATVCLIDYGITPAPGNVIIKDYSENEGMYEALREAGYIDRPVALHKFGHAGSVEAAECPLLVMREMKQ